MQTLEMQPNLSIIGQNLFLSKWDAGYSEEEFIQQLVALLELEIIKAWNQGRQIIVAQDMNTGKKDRTLAGLAKSFLEVLNEEIRSFDAMWLRTALEIFVRVLLLTKRLEELNYRDSVKSLARWAIVTASRGEAGFWRFICMPQSKLQPDGTWEFMLNNPRYDTLTRAVPADLRVLDMFKDFPAEIRIVLNDWELLFLRDRSIYKTLSASKKEKAIAGIESVRNSVREWVGQQPVDYKITFLSELVSLEEFSDLVDDMQLDIDENSRVFKNELEYVQATKDTLDLNAARAASRIRIAQYAMEASLLSTSPVTASSLYLNSEYPSGVVADKMRIGANLAMLFYADDAEIKNI